MRIYRDGTEEHQQLLRLQRRTKEMSGVENYKGKQKCVQNRKQDCTKSTGCHVSHHNHQFSAFRHVHGIHYLNFFLSLILLLIST
jgi:hypothetical protein